jgi:hypothetical protein
MHIVVAWQAALDFVARSHVAAVVRVEPVDVPRAAVDLITLLPLGRKQLTLLLALLQRASGSQRFWG